MLAAVNFPPKTVNEVRLYGINWRKQLQEGEYIVLSTWVVQDGLTVVETGLSEDYSTITLLRVSGGLARKKYRIINRISTSTGQLLEIAANLEVHSYT